MRGSTGSLRKEDLDHFREFGWIRIMGAFSAEAASAMREVVWGELAHNGIDRMDAASWTIERPAQLQRLRRNPVFSSIGSPTLLSAIDAILAGEHYVAPQDWGSLFLAFPTTNPWCVPSFGWHVDANYLSSLFPPGGVKTFALLGDVEPRSGGTLMVSGSHRLIHDWFARHPPSPGLKSAEMRKLLLAHPYIGALHEAGDRRSRADRFMEKVETINGIPLRIAETVGNAGDVYLLHPLLMHVAAPNNGKRPRFLMSGGVTTDMWGWGNAPAE